MTTDSKADRSHQGQEITFLETDGREIVGVIIDEDAGARRWRVLWSDGYGMSDVCMDSPYILKGPGDAHR